jgi:hypothetical protein
LIDSMNQAVEVTVSGTWWWLDKVPFSANWIDSTGATGERISYVFGTSTAGQNLKTSLETAINRCAALGVPIATITQGSSVDNMFLVPRITLNQSTCGQVISELVRICPDTMVWFDYSTKPVRMRITRRGNAGVTALDALSSPITSIDINPVIELQVSQVVLPYLDRNTQGRSRFQTQSSGTNYLSQKQIITISGPELDTFLPNDLFDSHVLTVTGNLTNLVHDSDPKCVAAAATAGLARLPISITATTQSYYASIGANSANFTIGSNVMKNSAGTTLTGYNFLITNPPPSWSTVNWQAVSLTCTMWARHTYRTQDGKPFTPIPAYWTAAGFSVFTLPSGFQYGYGDNDGIKTYAWLVKNFILTGNATNSLAAGTTTTVYRPADYSFISPPADLSANLLAAQNWLPYEGAIQIEQEDVGAARYRGTKVNLSSSLSSFANMGALVSGEVLEIETGRTTINLGAPARNDYRTLVDKIRKTSQDNIVYV